MKGSTPTIELLGTVKPDNQGNFVFPFRVGKGPAARTVDLKLQLTHEMMEKQSREPISLPDLPKDYWLFRNRAVKVENWGGFADEELVVHIKHHILQAENKWKRMKKQIEAFENLESMPSARRERIPESVRLFVWQRDEGKCVNCGSRENLEFDHIIPVAEGGSNTERNIQLLCERCNRGKGKSVS